MTMNDLCTALSMHTRLDAWHKLALQPALAELAFFPSRYLHPSWRARLFPDDMGDMVWSCSRAHEHLSQHIKATIGLPDLFAPDLDHRAWDLALLPGDHLHRLMQYLGVVAAGAHIRHAMSRTAIQTIIDQIGLDLYKFSLQSATLILASPADAAPLSFSGDFSDIGVRVRQAGRNLLERYIKECDEALWCRVRLKLEYDAPGELPDFASAITDAQMRRIVQRLMWEME
jgi:hypothetical protein